MSVVLSPCCIGLFLSYLMVVLMVASLVVELVEEKVDHSDS